MGAEIHAFASWIRPTEAEVAARETAIQQTTDIMQTFVKDYKVEVFGSSRNGLGLASSDIDLRLYQDWDQSDANGVENWMPAQPAILPPRGKVRRGNMRCLSRLQDLFQKHPDYILCNIRHARYPLLHMQHVPSGIDIQIVCANDTSKQRARIAKYLEEEPHLFDIYTVLRTLLDVRGLTDVFRGGLGSYNILVMIVAALKDLQRNGYRPSTLDKQEWYHPKNDDEKLAMDLAQVLGFYGRFLDTYKVGVIADPFTLVKKVDPTMIEHLDSVIFPSLPFKI
jgi:non-canonical poly(A) RNA polymerase PAPD5/7